MKKRIGAVLLCVALALICVGCGVDTYDGKIHLPQWGGDLERHWYIDESGAVSQKGKHTLDGEVCSVCQATVTHQDNGVSTVAIPNTYGDVVIYQSYDADGKVTWDTYNYYEHDEDGWLTLQITYDGDRLQEETTYQHDEGDDKLYPLVSTYYDESGTAEQVTYNDIGVVIAVATYDEDGNRVREEAYEREYGDDGNLNHEIIRVDGVISRERFYCPDSEGFFYIGKEIVYNPDGTVDTVTYYDIEGNVIDAPAA